MHDRQKDAEDASRELLDGPGLYEIRLKGHLDERWAPWFDGLTLTRGANGDTRLTGPVVDQSALHGVLRKVRDLNLPLVAVTRIDAIPVTEPDANAAPDYSRSKKETRP